MTAKEYMEQARYLDMQINSKIEQVRSLNELATRVTTVYSDMPHSPNRNTSRMEETIAKIIDLESEIDRDIDALVDLKREIMRVVNSIESAEYRTILEMRYLQFKKMGTDSLADVYGFKMGLSYARQSFERSAENYKLATKDH